MPACCKWAMIAFGDRLEITSGSLKKAPGSVRPDTVFIPYHWPLDRSANNLTIRAIDPVSNIPEFKICAVRVSKAEQPTDAIAQLETAAGGIR